MPQSDTPHASKPLAVTELMRPFAEFYAREGQPLPNAESIDGAVIPQPYRQLLVHDKDMTSTLEAFWQQPIHLRSLCVVHEGDVLTRQVILLASETGVAVELGAIRIHLQRFTEPAQDAIVEGYTPLGAIVREHGVEHYSRIGGFFRMASDVVTQASLDLRRDHMLYGRQNVLVNPDDQPLAEVVEVLSPASPDQHKDPI